MKAHPEEFVSDANDLGPDLAAGVAVTDIPDGGMKAGHIRGTKALLARYGHEVFCDRCRLQPFRRTARSGPAGGPRRTLPVASRLLQLAFGQAAGSAGIRPAPALGGCGGARLRSSGESNPRSNAHTPSA